MLLSFSQMKTQFSLVRDYSTQHCPMLRILLPIKKQLLVLQHLVHQRTLSCPRKVFVQSFFSTLLYFLLLQVLSLQYYFLCVFCYGLFIGFVSLLSTTADDSTISHLNNMLSTQTKGFVSFLFHLLLISFELFIFFC